MHDSLEINLQARVDPFTGMKVYVELVAPKTGLPFTYHWNEGDVPPFTGIAVKVTGVPAQNGPSDARIERLTGNKGFTVMVTVFEAAGFPVLQVALEVSIQETVEPFAGTNAYEAFVAPVTDVPFTFHW